MNKKQDLFEIISKKIGKIICAFIILVLVILNVQMYKKRHPKASNKNMVFENVVENELTPEEINKRNEEERINKLYNMQQSERIHIYLGDYVGYLKTNDYETAYSKLNTSFKQNYFNKLEDYEAYIKKYYPKDIVIEYGNEKQQGELSVVEITFKDASNKNFNSFTQRYVVRENGIMDYTISFQVE